MHVCVYVYVFEYAYMYVFMYVCMYIHIYIYISMFALGPMGKRVTPKYIMTLFKYSYIQYP